MKKKHLFMVAAVAVVVASGLATLKLFNSNDRGFTALELANIEALTEAENPLTPPCNNMTGYKKWETSGNDVYNKEHFRDCCYKEKKGYNPTPCI